MVREGWLRFNPMGSPGVELRPIEPTDVAAVAAFLHDELNPSVTAAAWARLMAPPWVDGSEGCGHLLESDGVVVGAYVTVESTRADGDAAIRVSNLAAFCVAEEFRPQSLRLLRATLARKGVEFTDLSPSGPVVALNERFGFVRLDTATRLVPNLPIRRWGRARVTVDPGRIATVLRGADLRIYQDHRTAAAARHLVVEDGDEYAYLLYRRDRRKGLRLFATPLHVGGNPVILRRNWSRVATRLLVAEGLPFTLAEHRVLGFYPSPGIDLARPRPKMFRSARLGPTTVDYLYSELTLLEW